MTDEVFDADNPSNSAVLDTAPAPANQPAPDITGKLEKRLNDSQEYIKSLKQERDADRALLETVTKKLEVFLQAQEVGYQPPNTAQPAPSVSADDLRKQGFVTMEDLQNAERKRIETQNLASVLEIGRKQYGEKLNEHIKARCAEIGVDVNWAKSQAASNPAVFVELFGLKKPAVRDTAPSESNIRTSSYQDAPADKPASIMYGATTKDMMSAWKRAATP